LDRNHAIGNSVSPAVVEIIGRAIMSSNQCEAI
jgi:site-specific DNA-cytosine methylase